MRFILSLRTLRLISTNKSVAKNFSWVTLDMVEATARTGVRGQGFVHAKVLGAYGRDTLNDNARRLLAVSAETQLSLVNTCFSGPKRAIPYVFQSPNSGKGRYSLELS